MSVNRLDNDFLAFLKAQARFPKTDQVTMNVTSVTKLKRYIDSAKLQARLDRVAEFRIAPAQIEYLAVTKRFTDEFLVWLAKMQMPLTKVMERDDHLRVTVKGTRAEMELWKAPISIQTHELYFNGVFATNELDGNVVGEGVRRFQVKMDLLRNSGVRFVDSGSSVRYSFEWYALLMQVLLGDAPDLILGTTNTHFAMTHGLRPVAYLDDEGLASDWQAGEVLPLSAFTLESGGARMPMASVKGIEKVLKDHPQLEGKTLVVSGVNAYEMAHLRSHFGPQLVFEWGADLTSDMGPAGGVLPLSFVVK